jgi:hypothetical protein
MISRGEYVTDENYLDMSEDLDILYDKIENESVIDAIQYQMDANLDHWTSYCE